MHRLSGFLYPGSSSYILHSHQHFLLLLTVHKGPVKCTQHFNATLLDLVVKELAKRKQLLNATLLCTTCCTRLATLLQYVAACWMVL